MSTDRLVRRFLFRNPDALTDADLLELLLRFGNGDAPVLAERLLRQFPSVASIMEATTEDLFAVEGMDEESALLLRLVPELHRRYFLSRSQFETRLTDSTGFGQYLLPYFYGKKDEMVYLLSLDGGGRVLNCRLLGQGSVNSVNIPIRRMVQEALTMNATAVVLAHNHPSGIAVPSKENVELTLRLRETFDAMDILLLDHIVVADDDFVSMRDSGYLNRF